MMTRITVVILSFAIILSLSGCRSDNSYNHHLETVMQMEQTDLDSPISGIRTGVIRAGIPWADKQFECTDDGVYYISHGMPCKYDNGEAIVDMELASYVFFCEHDSDQMIKLCGRPDCTHNMVGCNAYFEEAVAGISYYDGHLYVPTRSVDPKYVLSLYRMNLDGSQRVIVGNFGDASEYSGWQYVSVIDGVFAYDLFKLDERTSKEVQHRYYYKLDGSMKEPALAENLISLVKQDHTALVMGSDNNGNLFEYVFHVDIRNDSREVLFDKTAYTGGYWESEAGYVLLGHTITKVNYADGSEEALFDIDAEGNYTARFFPDCIMLIELLSSEEQSKRDPELRFYSWDGEYYGNLVLDIPVDQMVSLEALVGGETKDRILLSTTENARMTLPEYYIEKSEFGSGNIQLHRFQFPDLEEEYQIKIFGKE